MDLNGLFGLGGSWQVAMAIADVLIVSYVIYRVLLLIKGTTAVPMLVGLGMITVAFFASKWLGLHTFHWLVSQFLSYSFIFGIIVLFQGDIRRGLARLGQGWSLGYDRAGEASRIEELVQAAVKLAQRRHGALIVLERTAELDELIHQGIRVDAEISDEILLSMFQPGTPLHDGAVVISKGRIAAAKCVLPLSANPTVDHDLGTRHRSAIGLTEDVDAAVIVVSEERGRISLAVGGKIHRDMDPEVLRKFLLRLYAPPRRGSLPQRQRKVAA
ncbi:diadenylate cyclase CdaA [Vulgatibacter incomptus]|uniref:Diadenylate cyclase n=1 Tax=Vulgatibacter incomptus TaxID=1391653 RepID=A0A0K1PDP9_9BACT|nr:diadenylate cyclase CdaA [Vulgatibacter incomptus]AKU91632.1 Diadenylate cyclase spyDAC [Vulgatibacter incomptus]